MRNREEIEKEFDDTEYFMHELQLILEVLLDIRDLVGNKKIMVER